MTITDANMSAAMGLTASFQIRLAALARAKPGKITGSRADPARKPKRQQQIALLNAAPVRPITTEWDGPTKPKLFTPRPRSRPCARTATCRSGRIWRAIARRWRGRSAGNLKSTRKADVPGRGWTLFETHGPLYLLPIKHPHSPLLPYHSKKCHYMTHDTAYGSIAYVTSECFCLGARRE
jgi:hypothetical protein